MFGTPNNGIDKKLIKLDRYKNFKALSSDSDFITTLRKDWKKLFKGNPPFDTKVVFAINDEYVSRDSCFAGFNKSCQEVVDGKHLTMVKPKSEENDSYNLIISTLDSDLEFYNQYTNKNEINLALGNYNAVLKKLLPYYEGEIDPNDLYDNEIRQIVFAYEGLGQKQKALDFLEKAFEHVGNQNDFLGFFGGRHKREYLKTADSQEGELAFHYYAEGLKLARKKRNHSQKYYHAINLAFLSIVLKNEPKKMRSFAQYALRDAKKSKDHWKWATIAEANMYLGNLGKAKRYYRKAAKSADIRGKISMHTNAYAGYLALTNSKNTNDDFVIFLKATFLE